jgi:hypothetical protein
MSFGRMRNASGFIESLPYAYILRQRLFERQLKET